LAACVALCAPSLAGAAFVSAAPTPSAAASPSPDASSDAQALTPSAAALSPSASASASSPASLTPSAGTYADFLIWTVSALGDPLAAFLKQTGKQSISVAAGGFRELVTGERSPLCDHLDKDLTDRLRDDTPYGVPSTLELADAWISIGGNAADMTQPYTLRRFGRLLSVDAVVSGEYLVKGSSIIITVRLVGCADGNVLWSASRTIPEAAVDRSDLNTYSGSAPPGYGAQVAAPTPGFTGGTGTARNMAVVPETDSRFAPYAPPPGVELEANVHETEFSIYRLNFGAGYEYYDPTNPAFRAVAKDIMGPYVSLNWADVVHADFYLWYLSSLPNLPAPVDNLFGYGMKVSLTAPLRLGHYWVVYAGFGGRFETIDLTSPLIPSQDAVSFGNNSVFASVGAKAHWGPVGLEGTLDYDLVANYTPYFMAKLGLYYEYNFE
jgi:hypothetical protein